MSAEDKSKTKLDLQTTLRRLEAWQADSAFTRQRRFRRYAVRGSAQLRAGSPMNAEPMSTTVHVRDISRGGIGVLSSQPASPGQLWQVQLNDDRVTMATLPGFCRFCRTVSDGAYLIGIEFGAEASVLVSMGVSAAELAVGDRNEHRTTATSQDDFVDPSTLAA